MQALSDAHGVIADTNLREFFHDSIAAAVEHQQRHIAPETIFYLTNLLTEFSSAEFVFQQYEYEGNTLPPLAMLYMGAVEAKTRKQKLYQLKKLGDLSLFVSGLFSYSLNRSLVDVDYYVAMGGNAYAHLADTASYDSNQKVFAGIFAELSEKFVIVIDILTEVGDNMDQKPNQDVMRLYELWQRTGSEIAASRLRKLGIDPVATNRRQH